MFWYPLIYRSRSEELSCPLHHRGRCLGNSVNSLLNFKQRVGRRIGRFNASTPLVPMENRNRHKTVQNMIKPHSEWTFLVGLWMVCDWGSILRCNVLWILSDICDSWFGQGVCPKNFQSFITLWKISMSISPIGSFFSPSSIYVS